MRTVKRKENDEGVSAVIGTVMALMVFMFLFGMIQNQYVPIAMKDREANHMVVVESQFSQLKYGIDSLILNNGVNYSMYTPMTLGSEGMPVFASQTPGYLGLMPNHEYFNVTYTLNKTTDSGGIETTHIYSNTSGMLRLYVPNRYYVPQMYAYTSGAIILYQQNGAVMKADPNIRILNESGDLSVFMNTVRIVGTEIIKGGTDTEGVHSSLLYTYKAQSIANTTDFYDSTLKIQIDTIFWDAWMDWMNSTAASAGLHYGQDYTMSRSSAPINGNAYPSEYTVTIVLKNVKILNLSRSLVDMRLESQ